MEIGVPSRFACLNIEDEVPVVIQNPKPKEFKKRVTKASATSQHSKPPSKKSAPLKKPDSKPTLIKPAAPPSKKTKKKQEQQWEEWKLKDVEVENGLYEDDLRNAILLSKLDFEHNKEVNNKLPEPAENKKQDAKKKNKKNKTISLDKFLNNGAGKQSQDKHLSCQSTNCVGAKNDFFNSIDSDTKIELKKEQVNSKRKKREANINEVITLAQYQEKFEVEHQLRLVAEQELKKAKADLSAANVKIKTLCKLFSQGQMKDKSALLFENHRLNTSKEDLNDTVSNLYATLEKERSRVASITAALNNSNKRNGKKSKGN